VHTPDFLPKPGFHSKHWCLNDKIVFLNHGSFGACPEPVLRRRESLLRLIESDPMEFLLGEYPPLLASVLKKLSEFTGAEPESLVFVENATSGINSILKNIPLKPGDEILVSDQEYFSSRNSLSVNAALKGASVRQIRLPFPVASEDEIVRAIADSVTHSVKYVLIDHIVSSTGMILPLKKIIDHLSGLGISTIVDGAHGPGQIPLNLKNLGCLAYVGNCHKWLCAPRSSAILYVNPMFQEGFLPLAISHMPREFRTDLSDFQVYFMWNGTPDPTPALCAADSIDFIQSLHSEGWSGVMKSNRQKALNARRAICSALEVEPPCPDSMVGSMAAIPLAEPSSSSARSPDWMDPLQKWLKQEKRIVVPVTEISESSSRMIRISAQLYNSPEQYLYLAHSLAEYLNR
jgi:isopenicillin-N epimerase